jgi:aspartate aminotransferase
VYFINIGQPDIITPEPVWEAIRNYGEEVLSYGPAQGFLELRQAIADYFVDYDIPLTAENVIITVGGSEAIHFSLSVVADPGEEVIIPEPFYTNYNGYAACANVRIVPLTLHVEDGFRLPASREIEAKISPKTRAFLLCSPNNPTGTVYTEEELDRVIDLAIKHELFLISDEVYKEFVYDGAKHKSLLEYEDIKDRVQLLWRTSGSGHHTQRRCLPGGTQVCSGQVMPAFDRTERRAGRLSDGTQLF